LSLFIGNVVSTQLLGWWVAPAAFKLFGWWLGPEPGKGKEMLGYGVLAILYALSMLGAAVLLMLRAG
ncbi:MAG: antibiotic biosynthesis monooxygenase, partial [Azorhizobium sp. 32-67-21]